MKKKIGEWLQIQEIIQNILQQEMGVEFALSLAMMQSDIENKLKAFQDKRTELFKKYGEEKGDGTIQISQDKTEDFMKEFQPLLEMEVNIEVNKIKKEYMSDIKLQGIMIKVLKDVIEV